jgi:hypothetical protein
MKRKCTSFLIVSLSVPERHLSLMVPHSLCHVTGVVGNHEMSRRSNVSDAASNNDLL